MPWSKEPGRRRGVNAATRQRIMRQWDSRCHTCGHDHADNIDHIVNVATWLREERVGNYDDDSNLAPIHQEPCPVCGVRCHVVKTTTEAHHSPRRRPPERHPGLN